MRRPAATVRAGGAWTDGSAGAAGLPSGGSWGYRLAGPWVTVAPGAGPVAVRTVRQ